MLRVVVQDHNFDEQIAAKIRERREKRLPVSCKWIMLRAKLLFDSKLQCGESHIHSFSASRGWLQKFLVRHKFTLRRCTTISQKLLLDLIPKLTDFVIYIRKLQLKNNFDSSSIFACDETTVWFDMLSETTVDSVGVK